MKDYLKAIFKLQEIKKEDLFLYQNRSFYLLLLSCVGDRYRAADGITGIGYKTLTKLLQQSITAKTITKETESIDLLSQLFDSTIAEYVTENFNCLDLKNSYQMLLDGDKKEILSQIVDRSDLNSLLSLNKSLFKNNELRIESLLK